MIDEYVLANAHKKDFTQNYFESTQELIIKHYSKRDENKRPTETVNDVIYRVAETLALAELKYLLTPEEIIALTLEQAQNNSTVKEWIKTFVECIGEQIFWMNTPSNINADPEVALKVLQYQAYGEQAKMLLDEIWDTKKHIDVYKYMLENPEKSQPVNTYSASFNMGRIATEIKGKGCLAACGVVHAEDSLDGIHKAAQIEATAAKNSMGMGINTSTIRPWNSTVSNGAAASGPDRFYEKTIASTVAAVAQGGRRGGALIELRDSNHPDLLFFIDKKKLLPQPVRTDFKTDNAFGVAYHNYLAKQDYLKNTNVSVCLMPGFMKAVINKEWYPAVFDKQIWNQLIYDPRKPLMETNKRGVLVQKQDENTKELLFEEYSIDSSKYPEVGGHYKGHFYAPEVFDRIVEGMRDSGEPGIVFYETVNASNANNHVYDLQVCNPCGEQMLPVGPGKDGRQYMGICNLSSMHAAHKLFFNSDGSYNYVKMQNATHVQLRAMDNTVDVSWFPFSEQNLTARLERRAGGGFAGVAEFLARLELRFGTADANAAVTTLFSQYTKALLEASMELALERGVYPLWDGSSYQAKNKKVRNTCMGNNAPTGTLAQIMQTSWGIEPFDAIVFSRQVRTKLVDFVAPGFEDAMFKTGIHVVFSKEDIRKNGKTVKGMGHVPLHVQNAFPIRKEIEPEAYINHLAAVYAGAAAYPETFNSVSNTCSIEPLTDPKFIANAIKQAWSQDVKAITFYPDGSRLSQPIEKISVVHGVPVIEPIVIKFEHKKSEIDSTEMVGISHKVAVGTESGQATMHITMNHSQGSPGLSEVYLRMGKTGGIISGLCEALGRLISSFLQFAAQYGEEERAKAEQIIIKQLIGIETGFVAWHKFPGKSKPNQILSLCDAVAKTLMHYQKTKVIEVKEVQVQIPVIVKADTSVKLICQDCGGVCQKYDGCTSCQDCGSSKCG